MASSNHIAGVIVDEAKKRKENLPRKIDNVFVWFGKETKMVKDARGQVAQCTNTSVWLLWPHLHVCIVRPDPVCAYALGLWLLPIGQGITLWLKWRSISESAELQWAKR